MATTTTTLVAGERSFNLALDPTVVAEGTNGAWANLPSAENLALEALIETETSGGGKTKLGTVVPVDRSFTPLVGPIPVDRKHEAARIRDSIMEAAVQLRNWAPGIVVIDTSMDPALMRRCCDVAELMDESWASQLAAVLFLADTFPGFTLTIVKGPLYQALASARIRGPRICSDGHLHVDTFGVPPKVCTLDKDFDDPPAFCVPGRGHYWFTPG